MELLPFETIQAVHRAAVQQRLDREREAMLATFDQVYVAGMATNPTPNVQLMLDLADMNRTPEIVGGVVPLERWLRQAAFLSAAVPSRQKFFGDLADQVARAAHEHAAPAASDASVAADAPLEADTRAVDGDVPERILFKNELLPAAFMAGAARTLGSVVRLVVPQFDGDVPRLRASSGEPATGLGTGWLIGARHLITNWHVVEARSPDERPRPALDEVRRQCAGTVAEFDYDVQGQPAGLVRAVDALVHHHPGLDYAILRLAEPAGAAPPPRAPLPLREEALTVSPDDPFPVNIVQHPGGAAKQLGIRNNLVASLRGIDLTYFTDTAGGSSGAPVCDDRWQVVALHRGSRFTIKELEFQGKETSWINVGTPIRLIVEDLRDNAPAVWADIGARLA